MREEHRWLAENKRLKAQTNRLDTSSYGIPLFVEWQK
jgi:hypothetical protein